MELERSTMNPDDEPSLLLARAQAGDLAALEALLQAVQPQLYRFSMKMCRHSEDAEDVLQDTMLTLARSFRDFRGESSLSTWLFTVVRSICIKKRRKSRFAPEQEESLEQLSPGERGQLKSRRPGPHDQAESAEIWLQVQEGIKQLDPIYREILVLRDIEGLRAREVAEVVGISVPAVKSRLHRARAQLRIHLADTPYRPRPGCPDIRTVFSRHLEGELSPDICATMEAHVAGCPICMKECDGLKAVLSACSSAPCIVPDRVQVRLQAALRQVLGVAEQSS